jgi:hypothetical protein
MCENFIKTELPVAQACAQGRDGSGPEQAGGRVHSADARRVRTEPGRDPARVTARRAVGGRDASRRG